MSAAISFSVQRKDFVRRSRVTLRCSGCGITEVHCQIGDARIYEDGFNEHVCRFSAATDLTDRPALRQML